MITVCSLLSRFWINLGGTVLLTALSVRSSLAFELILEEPSYLVQHILKIEVARNSIGSHFLLSPAYFEDRSSSSIGSHFILNWFTFHLLYQHSYTTSSIKLVHFHLLNQHSCTTRSISTMWPHSIHPFHSLLFYLFLRWWPHSD
jgi:hypothetical protein